MVLHADGLRSAHISTLVSLLMIQGHTGTGELPPLLSVQHNDYGGEGADPHVLPPPEIQGMAALPKPSAVHILLCGLRTCCPSALHAALLVGEMRQEVLLGACSSVALELPALLGLHPTHCCWCLGRGCSQVP